MEVLVYALLVEFTKNTHIVSPGELSALLLWYLYALIVYEPVLRLCCWMSKRET